MLFPKYCEKNDFHCGASRSDPFYRKGIRNPCCLNHLMVCLDKSVELLNKLGIRYWLDCATLLGQYRHGGVLPWDLDIDFSLFEEDIVSFLNKTQEIKNDGFWFCFRNIEDPVNTIRTDPKEFTGRLAVFKLQTSLLNKMHVDFYSCKLIENLVVRANSSWPAPVFPFDFVKELEIVEFHGIKVNRPKKVEDYLYLLYGEDFKKIPDHRIFDMKLFKNKFNKYKDVLKLNNNDYDFGV